MLSPMNKDLSRAGALERELGLAAFAAQHPLLNYLLDYSGRASEVGE